MNPVISREYVNKNYIHKEILKEVLVDILMVGNRPVKNTQKKQCYKALQTIQDMVNDLSKYKRGE